MKNLSEYIVRFYYVQNKLFQEEKFLKFFEPNSGRFSAMTTKRKAKTCPLTDGHYKIKRNLRTFKGIPKTNTVLFIFSH